MLANHGVTPEHNNIYYIAPAPWAYFLHSAEAWLQNLYYSNEGFILGKRIGLDQK